MIRLILALFLFLSPPAPASDDIKMGAFLGSDHLDSLPEWFKSSFLDLSEDIQEASDENRHAMVYFHQNGCPYCSKLVKDNFTNPNILNKLNKDFDVIETNMWGDREIIDINGDEYSEKDFSAKMRVQFTPTILFFDNQGRIPLRLNGYQSSAKLSNALNYVSSKQYYKSSFASYLNSVIEAKKGKLNSGPFFVPHSNDLSRSPSAPSKKFLAVFFETPQCKECDILHEKLLTLKKTKEYLSQFEIARFNPQLNTSLITPSGSHTTSKDWYDELKLTFSPSIVFFDKSGNEVIRMDAMFKSFHFHGFLTYMLTESFKTQSSFQRYLEDKADRIRETGKDVNIWTY